MPANDHVIDFEEVARTINELAALIKASAFQPDFLIGLARGGWVPTRLLSSALKVKEILSVGMKYGDAERKMLVTYSKPDPMPKGMKLLLIEDCLESGKALHAARDLFLSAGNEVKTASLFVLNKTVFPSDFYVKKLEQPPKFPWE